ncbi:MAG: phage portal protein [Saccharothrix sp.]|nr:phage portal protein [Saccharothrix sp.]
MGFARSVARASIGSSSGLATPEKWVEDWFTGGGPAASGVHVNEDTALTYGPFFAGVRVIAEDLGSLPLPLYERLARGKRRATSHPLYALLHDAANPLMGAMAFRETLQGHALTWGGGLANIVRNGAGEITELWPLRPDRTIPEVRRTAPGKISLSYRYADQVNGIYARLLPDEVLHIAGLGFDGIRGYSVVHLAKQAIGLGLATEKYGSAFFGNGSRPGGVLTHPGTLSKGARERMAADWENLHRGLDRAQRVAILEEGVNWQQIGIPPEDAQFLETRKLQVTEMARWLRLPPHKIGDLERATFSNIEELQLDYVASALRSWLVRWEQAITLRLLLPSERGRYFAEHLVDGLLRGNTMARYQAYAIGRNWGWLSADDIREKENLNPLPDGRGETYLVPLNMVPAPTPEQADDTAPAGGGQEQAARRARLLRGRSAEARRRIAQAFAPLIQDADARLARLERDRVTELAEEHLAERGRRSAASFLTAVRGLYDTVIRAECVAAWLPLFSALAAETAADAAADVGYDGEVDLTRWVAAYTESHAAYRVASAIGQITATVDRHPEDPAAAVAERLETFVADRPQRTARWETAQVPNAAAREAWRTAGVRRLRWVTTGKNCPFCQDLEGRVVDIETPFVPAGGEVTGLEEKLKVDRNTFHPPIHPGCDCQVVPE